MRRFVVFLSLLTAVMILPGAAYAANSKTSQLRAVPASKLNPRLGFGRVLNVKPARTAKEFADLKAKFVTVNPSSKPINSNPVNHSTPATQDASWEIALDSNGASRPLWGSTAMVDLGALPSAGASTTIRTASASSVLTSMPVATGQDSAGNDYASIIGEPSVAGVPGALMYTGNWHAAVSGNDGLSWKYLDPQNIFPAADGTARSDNGTCCDQVVLSERGSSSDALTVWLGQSSNVSSADGNRLRLLSFQGRDELISQSGYCSTDLSPSAMGFSSATMFDFNQMARTKKWLYVTSNIYNLSADDSSDTDSDPQKTPAGSIIIQVSWGDLESGDCSPQVSYVVPSLGQTMSPTQGADSASDMYFATHISSSASGNMLRIYRLSDSSTSLLHYDKNIDDFTSSSRGDLSCELPDRSDACSRSDSRISTGWYASGKAGWLWNVAEGADFDYPHIQGYVFNTATKNAAFQHTIWNSSFAWIYPAVSVNDRGEVGMTAYKAGGGDYVRARSFMISNPGSLDSWEGLQSQGVVSSTHGVGSRGWGDYSTLSAYPGCPRTMAAAVWSMQGGNKDANSEHRFAWFGEQGCANLGIEKVAFWPGSAKALGDVAIGVTLRNSGTANAGASKTKLYLSKDPQHSATDKYVGAMNQSALSAGAGRADGDAFIVPARTAAGSYWLIACADSSSLISETTNTDNCTASEDLFVVSRTGIWSIGLSKVAVEELASHASYPVVSSVILTDSLSNMKGYRPVVSHYASPKRFWDKDAVLLLQNIPSAPHPAQVNQPVKRVSRVALPDRSLNLSKLKPGAYHIFSCLRPAKRKTVAADCVEAGQLNRPGLRQIAKPKKKSGQ